MNAICPGYIETEMNRDFWQTAAGKRLIDRIPQRRIGKPEHLDGGRSVVDVYDRINGW